MDVRQYAFLARLPSAAVKSRDQFWGMPKRGLAFLLANVMFWQPMWAQADGIVVANPGTTLDRAGNGVQIINIATPNGAGLSHNQFHDYNVGAQGVILNNGSNQASSTQLGGYIVDNPHLKNSGSAQAILNEVIGGSPSQLRGYTEVAGQSARVIVANPYGITCNGCGFINSPRVTLTTGKPVLDGSGRLDRFQVDQGSVAIEGAGLNATNVDRFEIITRSAKINAEIQAKNLTIVAGRNDVNADNLNATARADDGSTKPQLAIDSSALGGMYAGAIKLVGTEAGVGVKLDGKLIASGGDIQLDANGQLSLAETSATGAVNVKAASLETRSAVYAGTSLNVQTQGDLTNRQTLAARDSISLSAGGQLTNAGAIEAGVNADGGRNANGDLSLSAQAIDNRGKGLVASRNLTVNAAQTLNNQSGTLSGQNTSVTAGTLDNRNAGRVLGSASLNLNAGQVLNTQGVINSAGNLTGTVGQLINRNGELSSQGDTVLTVTSLDNVAGLLMAGRMLDITASGAINNATGKLGGKTALNVRAQNLDNSQQGQLTSEGALTTRISGQLNNQNKGLIQANGAMDVQATRLDNRAGKISGLDNLTVSSANTDNRGGVIRSDKALKALVGELDNRDKGRLESKAALTFEGNKLDNRNGGLLTSTGLMTLKASEVNNAAGRMSGKADIDANIDTLNQQGGELVAEGNLLLTGKNLDNRQDGLVGSLKNLTVNVEQIDNRGGSLSSQQALLVNGTRLDNSEGGKVLSDTTLGLKVAQIINATNGLIFSKGASTLSGIGLSNVGGRIVSQADLQMTFDEAMDNQGGLVSSEGRLTLKVGSLDNRLGKLSSLEAMALTSTGAVLNQGGLIASQKGLVFNSGSLDNSDQGIISAKADSTLTTGEFKNRHEGSLATDGTLQLKAAHLDNSGGRIGSQQQLDVSVNSLEQDGGELFSNADLTLDMNHGLLNNQRGNLHTPGQLLLKNLAEVNNSAGEISGANAWSLNAQSLNNDGGKLLSNQKLTLVVDQALSNIKGLIASAGLDSRSASLDNTGGEIRGRGEVDLTVTDLFDNQAGVVIADDGLRVTAARLDNRQEGLVGSTKALTLTVDRVDNRSGELSSKAGVSLIGAWLDNSDSGYIAAGSNLALTVGQVINHNKGLMSGDTGLTLTGQTLENSGRLSSGKDLAITLSSDLNNNQGSLISEGALAINAQSLSNNGGTLSSARNLTVDTRGAVSNQGGKLLTDTALTINSSALDNQQKGVISSKTGLNINTGDFNNSQGSLYSADQLELNAGQVTNTSGSIGAANALVANIKGLDQQGGKLFSTGDLSLNLKGGALNNQDGFVSAPGQLRLKNLGDVNNRGGEISSEQAFDLIAASLDNSGGQVLSNQKLTLTIDKTLTSIKGKIAAAALRIRAASLDNSDGGVLLSDSDLEVTVDGLLSNRNKGSIKAAQKLTLNSTGLDNQGGTLVGIAGLAIDLGTTAQDLNNQDGMISSTGLLSIAHLRDLNNQSGVINSKGVLSIATLRALNNQKGEISSVNSFSLTGNSLDNRGGNLISNDQLTLTAPELKNQGGLISGWKGVTVNGGTLDNSQEGSISSLLGNLNIDLSGALINHSNGGLGGIGEVTIKATRLDNTSGTVTSGGKQTLTITGGTISNGAGGFIESGDTLDVRAATLNNAGGRITASKALTFTGTQLDNSGGSLVGKDSVTLDLLGALTNVNGALGSTGPLVIKRSASLDNRGGQLISQSLLDLLTHGDLNNSAGGTISANGQLDLKADGTLHNNADGLISSRDAAVNLTAAALNNGKGAVQSFTAMTVNTGTGAIDNQVGKLIAQTGDLNITAASLDSRGGVLSSLKGLLQTRLTGVLRNGQGGKIEGSRLDLRALGGIYSDGGRIAANTGDILLDAGANALDNSAGGIYAKGQVKVSAGSMNNNAGQVSGSVIDLGAGTGLSNRGGLIESASTLAVRATNLDNQSGKLRALGTSGKTDFQIGSLFDNRNGLVETANTHFTLAAPSFLNAGGSVAHVGVGEFDISTANVMNAGGLLVTRGGLTLNADSWTNSSVIQAGRLTLNINNFTQTASGQVLASNQLTGRGVNWYNDGLIASDGGMDIQLGGSYGGNGRVSSLGDLTFNTAQMNLSSAATIGSGGPGTFNIGGLLNNAGGRLTSNGDLTIAAGGVSNTGTLGAGQNLTIKTASLVNNRSLIFSGGNMNLLTNDFTNQTADVYSIGNLTIAGSDGGRANTINNLAASINVDGDFSLSANSFNNKTEGVIGEEKFVSGDITFSGTTFYVNESFESTSKITGPQATLSVAGNLTANVGSFTNTASLISAGKSIKLDVDTFDNFGLQSGNFTRMRVYQIGGLPNKRPSWITDDLQNYADRNSKYQYDYIDSWHEPDKGGTHWDYQALNKQLLSKINTKFGIGPEVAVPAPILAGVKQRDDRIFTNGGGSVPSIIQAGQAVTVNAKSTINNGNLNPYTNFDGTAKAGADTGVKSSAKPTVVFLNQQLPPDLAQQQVNPLALPGFTLPTGDNGLFRLSRKDGSDQELVAGRDWTIGTIAASSTQRSDGMPVRSATQLQFDQNDPVSMKKRDLTLASRPSLNLNDKTALINVNAVAGDGPVGVMAPNRGQVSFDVPRVQGLPDTSVRSNPHKYLIETNPALTNLKQFMSSDYLLGKLGYDPDTSAKRLGDGLFEQRLVQQAVVARTGQRFIDGQTSDEAMFKYLMNNAVTSKNELNLSLGVTLTAQQVAALTHDIVWLEEHEVNGEKVLVPVLYLAQANNRLAPNGALIQGGDVTLIAGADLNNAGTLRASNNLLAEAGNNLTNSGLIEAGDRLTLKAGNNIVNKGGGVISGRDVSLTATNGDVINQRDVYGYDTNYGGTLQHRDVLNNAARIEAANDLKVDAGRDISNIGGVLQSSRDMTLDASRDVNITSVQDRRTDSRGSNFLNQTITQHGAQVKSGRDLTISADRDVAVVASRLDAKRDLKVDAGKDIVITSAADESDYVSRGKKFANETHSITQQASVLNAGRDVALKAGNDLGIIASRIKAEENVSLDADQDITVASAKDESSSYYYKKKNGSFGRSKTTERQSYESENVASVIEAGRDLTVNTSKDEDGSVSLDGGRNVTIIGSQLKAGNDLVVGATQDVAVLSATEESGSYSKKTKTGLFGMSKSGSSQLQTAVTQVGSQLDAGHDAVILGGRDVRLNASEISAKNDAELHAGLVDKEGDITLSSADDQAYSRAEEYKKKVGLSLKDAIGWAAGTPGFGADMTFATSHNRGREVVSAVSVGSQVSAGNDAFLNAAHDINVIGSGISAVNNASLDAGRDVNVVASIDSQRSNSWETDKSVGIKQTIDSNAFTTFVGGETVQHGVNSKGYTAASSAIDAGMNINVNAGRDINLQGSDVVAENNIRFKAERNINIDAKEEASEVTIRDSIKRNGITVSTAYNIGNTIDGLKGTGKGEDGVSKGSSVLKAVDTLDQFFSGPKYDGHIGASSVSSSNTQTSVTQRPSTLSADNDISLDAGNNVNVIGSRFNAGRDINVKGKDITFDVAHGSQDSSGHSTQSKGGVKGGTNGGFKLGVGVSNAGTEDKSTQGTSTATQLNAGGSINLDAKNDLTLIGTRAIAERDISLKAANDLNILSAQNAYESSHDRRSWGAEGGIIAGQDGFGVYGSANVGIGDLNREGVKQQEAYLYAGNKLNFESKRDTTIAGATLRGDEVLGDVGRNLTVSSVPNTGKVEGKEFDASLTVAFSIGATVSGSLGYGETNGKTNWVDNQTVISGKSKVDIRTEKHTQLDGSVVTADNGNLKLDTDTLGYRNITGKDNEHGYYLNVSGSYTGASANGGSGGAQADKPNKGMEGESKSSWAVEGYKYDKDRQQTLNATVGAGQIVVRHDKTTGQDSTSGLNRDVNRAYEITKDEEHRTDLYVSSSSIDAISHPGKTLDKWENSVTDFTENQKVQATQVYDAIKNNWNKIQSQHVDINDVPKSISKEFGEERALAIAKNIVRAGGDLEALESLDPNILKALVDFADKAAVFDGNLNSCIENKTCTVKGPDGWKPGMPYEIGVTVTSNLPRNAGEAMLSPLVSALKLADNLPKEQIQAIGLSIQAIMGPFKLVVSLAAQAALKEAFGPEYERVKEESAINLAAFLTDRDPKTLKEFNDADKKDVNSVLKGDPYVKAAEFLIDSALGEIKNLGIRQVSRVLSVNAGSGAPPKTSTSGFQLTFDKATRIWTTPAGLEYGRGTRQGTRINHVLEHAKPNPNKQNHTVFSMDRKEILGVVDEAWTKRGNPVANDPGAYIVPMGRVVGTAGETNVKVVVIPGTNTVLTAYPVP
ncbi:MULTISPECIES: hemagglutinin repeat-containing protein [Pseudomonas]|uniref:hemagglutinin repeat-containing protein n=1 Tax=Pseudomonas TaxID=286 RepID=UPI000876F7AA|nr:MULTISPECIES: hemagglutinin repeat-containing protein [Pseudomonas]SCZ31790.1 filamentous hemagglutinin [Pseudomonas sp. NFIX46]SDB20957.1 filamentous hemagglutinin [Pseudomonas putida]SFQ93589.1 filamentous hemagglutinin [Pseudomonas sp. NFIX49]